MFEPFPGRFGARLGSGIVDPRTSSETYVLSEASPHNVKLRANRLEVKLLEDVRDDGCELWRPVLTAAFPVTARDLVAVWHAWGLSLVPFMRSAYFVDQFFTELVAPTHQLRAVVVTKARAQFSVLGCQAERALLSVGGAQWETVALEDVDPARITSVLWSIGEPLPATSNYPALLKQIVGIPAVSLSELGAV
jgi:exopolyphosphatase/guanosine-5'-triphosphate,3'-diphosphate pyrophosphatase